MDLDQPFNNPQMDEKAAETSRKLQLLVELLDDPPHRMTEWEFEFIEDGDGKTIFTEDQANKVYELYNKYIGT